jgi:hypothetical protein
MSAPTTSIFFSVSFYRELLLDDGLSACQPLLPEVTSLADLQSAFFSVYQRELVRLLVDASPSNPLHKILPWIQLHRQAK